MSSGFGVKGNTGRCYPFWKAYENCLADAPHYTECLDYREDYIECLHRRKEIARAQAILREKQRLEKEGNEPPKSDGHGGH